MPSMRHDDDARRRYWAEQMDAACLFMQKMAALPVEECGESMVSLPDAAAKAGAGIVFSTAKAPGGGNRLFYLRKGLVPSIVEAAREMERRGWRLKVEDAYRTVETQRLLALREDIFDTILVRTQWELGGRMPTTAETFKRVSALVATRPKVGTHMSGSALDISVLRRDGTELDRGGPYLELSELTPMDSPFVSPEAAANRRAITDLMARHGFFAYPSEFWHYSSGDVFSEHLSGSGRPARYGAVDMRLPGGEVEAISNPTEPLHSDADIAARIERSLKRLAEISSSGAQSKRR